MSVNEKMTAIADAIREKKGGTEPLTLDDMATEIPKVFDAGKQAQQKEFMDLYQESALLSENGTSRLFAGTGWNNYTFYPTQDINMKYGSAFYYFAWGHTSDGRCDLVKRLDECGVKLICSDGLGSMSFAYAWVITVPKLTITASNDLTQLFRGAKFLKTVTELEFPEDNSFTFDRTFENNINLEDIVITGTIANDVDFSYSSKLTAESIVGKLATEKQITAGKNLMEFNGLYFFGGILGALKDFGGTTTTKTIYLNSVFEDNVSVIPSAFIETVTSKGWSVSYK